MSYPYPSLVSPVPVAEPSVAEQIEHNTIEWAKHYGLIHRNADVQLLLKHQYGTLIARAFPQASPSELQLVADWHTWRVLFDDQCDKSGLGRAPALLGAYQEKILTVFHGGRVSESSPHFCALYDIAQRFRAYSDQAWYERFLQHVDAYCKATLWEANNRAWLRVPDLRSYTMMRPYTSFMYGYFTLIEYINHLDLPDKVYKHRKLQNVLKYANNSICWTNDLVSFHKEQSQSDVHNVVAVLYHTREYPLPKALKQATAMQKAEIQRFQQAIERLPSFGSGLDIEIEQVIQGLQHWIRAYIDWSLETTRYQPRAQREKSMADMLTKLAS